MTAPTHISWQELEAGLEKVRCSPGDEGRLEMIVRRPRTNEREVLETGELDLEAGLVGDCWRPGRASSADDDGSRVANQLTIMNARVVALVAGSRERWRLAGDQLYIDLDLSEANLPPGTRLALGSAVIEITSLPHTGCRKFLARFGPDALKFVNSPVGRELHLRGIHARVVQPGRIRVGDAVRRT
jgi:hypothetical protein